MVFQKISRSRLEAGQILAEAALAMALLLIPVVIGIRLINERLLARSSLVKHSAQSLVPCRSSETAAGMVDSQLEGIECE